MHNQCLVTCGVNLLRYEVTTQVFDNLSMVIHIGLSGCSNADDSVGADIRINTLKNEDNKFISISKDGHTVDIEIKK